MDKATIELFDNEYVKEGGCWSKDVCVFDGEIETYSGPGSLLKNTNNLIKSLNSFIEKNIIKSIIDAPCGDFNYMKEVNLVGIDYKGFDVSSNAIEICKKYQKDNINFLEVDITEYVLPYADLIICKDLFIHLSCSDISLILENVVNSGCKFFATSRYNGANCSNSDKETSQSARGIEITTKPFYFKYDIVDSFKYTTDSDLKDEIIIFKII